MDKDGTVPVRRAGMPVKAIRVEVTSGPDAGKSATAEAERLVIGTAEGNDLRLSDPTVSRFHLALERQHDRIVVDDRGSTNGTTVGAARFQSSRVEVRAGTEIEIGSTRLKVSDGNVVLEEHGPDQLGGLVGKTPAMRRLLAAVERVAASNVPVLILGESGTGKELIAQAIHERSRRADAPLVTLDCGALSPTLFSSEVFGHEKGAFTGADRQHAGAFERAETGTVFLDEVGELLADLQAALLGVLERRRFRRVGGKQEIGVDVRVISATHRDLFAAVNAGGFRLDLFYRLSVVVLEAPALRERKDDIPLLIEHFLRESGHTGPVEQVFPNEAIEELSRHDFPGNVRELKNIVLGTLALGRSPALDRRPSGPSGAASDPVSGVLDLPYRQARDTLVEEFERRYLERLLQRSDDNVRQAAREARMNRSYLIELLKKHGLR